MGFDYRIGPYELRPRARLLSASGVPVVLAGRAFDVLLALVAARGGIVGKAALIERVWGGVFVEEANLYVQISTLRRALGPFAGWIVTVPGRGYMFAGPIEAVPHGAGPATAPPVRRLAVAVTPFENLGADPRQGFLADGLAEEIIFGLSRIGWLFVIARNSSFALRDQPMGAREAGRRLGARYLVGGAVRRAGGALRVHCRLTDAEEDREIWVDRFDAPWAEVADLLGHVVARLVGRIESRIVQAEAARTGRLSPEELDAFDHVLRARAALARRGEASHAAAAADLEGALRRDPGCPSAAALLNWCRQVQSIHGWRQVGDGEGRALLEACARAVEAAPEDPLVLAHAASGISYWSEDRAAALDLARRAAALSPSYSFARYLEGWMTLQCADPEGALPLFKEAIALSPLDELASASACTAGALALLHLGRSDEALEWSRRAIRFAPDYAYTRRVHIAALAHADLLADARAALRGLLGADPGFTLARYRTLSPLVASEVQRPIIEGLRAAGCP